MYVGALLKPFLSKTHVNGQASDQSRWFRVNYNPNAYQVRWTLKRWEKTAQDRFDPRGLATSRIAKNILETLKETSTQPSQNHYKVITTHSLSGKIRAICLLKIPPDQSTAHISQLVSAPKSKAKGSGKTAMFGAHHYAKKAGYQRVSLTPYNNRVSQFYQGFGYKQDDKGYTDKAGMLVLDLQA